MGSNRERENESFHSALNCFRILGTSILLFAVCRVHEWYWDYKYRVNQSSMFPSDIPNTIDVNIQREGKIQQRNRYRGRVRYNRGTDIDGG